MTAFCGALASFYRRVPVFHIEAGLRSHNLLEPFPEEALRQMITRIACLHFSPTERATSCLLQEGVAPEKIIQTGNTGIDALSCLSKETLLSAENLLSKLNIRLDDKLVLITAHRRENHGERLDNILKAIKELAAMFPEHQFVLPVHPNPNVHGKVHDSLKDIHNAVLTAPLEYPSLQCAMRNAKLVLTDSGGIQEEAPTFGVPVLVMRYETERTEGVSAGFAKLVGADHDKIIKEASAILGRPKNETRLDGTRNPYGDGHASERVEVAIGKFFERDAQ
jgi:UDP-N-acetylglucosamine 2-epimerase (non-hydrolysing)